jgi:acyl-CoA thioesterase
MTHPSDGHDATTQSPNPDAPSDHSPFWLLLGIEPVRVDHGEATVRVKIEHRHLRTLGLMHGGVLASLMDSSLGLAAWSAAPADHTPVTIQLNVNFVKAAPLGETITAASRMQHLGRHTAVGHAEAHNSLGELVGAASATFLYVTRADRGPIELPAAARPLRSNND